MSNTRAPNSVTPTSTNTSTVHPSRRLSSNLRFPLYRPPSRNPRPSLEALEDNRQVARQTERNERETSIDIDDISNSSDSDNSLFTIRARRFRNPDYVSPPPSTTQPVSALVEKANAEMLDGKIEISGDFLCPLLQTIPLDPVKMNGVIFEKSAIEKYIHTALSKTIVSGDKPRVVKDILTRKVLYQKEGDNCAMNDAAIDEVTSNLTSALGDEWDNDILTEI